MLKKTIPMHKIFIIIDSNGGNSISANNHFHGKVPHREDVMEQISEYLGE